MHLSRQWNCWSLRCSWSIACRRCSNFILHWSLGFNILCEDNCKPSRETFKFWDLVRLILEILRLLLSDRLFNSLRPRRNGHYNTDDIFKCIFLKENVWIPTQISLKFVPKGPIDNIPALVQIMAWRRPGDKPLSEPMMVSLLTHMCVTRPQWVNVTIHTHKLNVYSCNKIFGIDKIHNKHELKVMVICFINYIWQLQFHEFN